MRCATIMLLAALGIASAVPAPASAAPFAPLLAGMELSPAAASANVETVQYRRRSYGRRYARRYYRPAPRAYYGRGYGRPRYYRRY